MNSSTDPEHVFIESAGQSADYDTYYDADGNILDLADVVWSQHQYVAINNDTGLTPGTELVPAGRIVALAFFMVIFVVGVVGNGLVVYTVSRQVYLRKVTYLYLLNLSVSNLLYLVICLPTLSVSHTLVNWPFGNVLCKTSNYVMSVSMAVSVLTITATGIDRYLAVIYPMESRTARTTNRAVLINGSCWLIALVLMVPRIFIYNEKKVFHIVSAVTLCYRVEDLFILQIDTSLNFVIMYLIPLVLLSMCHYKIGKRLWYITKPGTRSFSAGNTQVLVVKDRRRIAKIVFAITIVFALGWLPIHVYHLAEDFNHGHVLFGPAIDRGTLVLFFSFGANSMNPILYCMFSSSFRQSFKKVLGLCTVRLFRSVNVENVVAGRPERNHPDEYRRPPPVLLPRPATTSATASLLVRPYITNTVLDLKTTTPLLQGTSSEFCVNNLEAAQKVRSESSPISIKKEPKLEVGSEEQATQLFTPTESSPHHSKPRDIVLCNLTFNTELINEKTSPYREDAVNPSQVKSYNCNTSQVKNGNCKVIQIKDQESEEVRQHQGSTLFQERTEFNQTSSDQFIKAEQYQLTDLNYQDTIEHKELFKVNNIMPSNNHTLDNLGLSSHYKTEQFHQRNFVDASSSVLHNTISEKLTRDLPQVE